MVSRSPRNTPDAKNIRYQTAAQEYMRLADDDDKMYSKAKRWWIQALSMYRLCRPASHPVVKNAERVLQNIERILLKPVV